MGDVALKLTPVVLSGGAGTRLWPLSRELYPKQLLPLTSEYTMLQETVRRVAGLQATALIVVCNDAHRFMTRRQLQEIGLLQATLIAEPVGRNTAPALTLAALSIDDPKAVSYTHLTLPTNREV